MVQFYSQDKKHPEKSRLFSCTTYTDIRNDSAVRSVFSDVLSPNTVMLGLGEGEGSRRAFVATISSNYFRTLDVPLAQGRSFLPEEETPVSGIPVVIVSYLYWKHTGFDPQIIGKTIRVNEAPEWFPCLLGWKMVLREGLIITAGGAGLGLLLAFAIGHVFSGMLFEVSRWIPLPLPSHRLCSSPLRCFTCWLPARRATRADPMVGLAPRVILTSPPARMLSGRASRNGQGRYGSGGILIFLGVEMPHEGAIDLEEG